MQFPKQLLLVLIVQLENLLQRREEVDVNNVPLGTGKTVFLVLCAKTVREECINSILDKQVVKNVQKENI